MAFEPRDPGGSSPLLSAFVRGGAARRGLVDTSGPQNA